MKKIKLCPSCNCKWQTKFPNPSSLHSTIYQCNDCKYRRIDHRNEDNTIDVTYVVAWVKDNWFLSITWTEDGIFLLVEKEEFIKYKPLPATVMPGVDLDMVYATYVEPLTDAAA